MCTKEDRDASLDAFDHCYELMLKINPRFAKKQFEEVFDVSDVEQPEVNLKK